MAIRTKTGDDASPFGNWQATMMANSFRDPYFRAELQKESLRQGGAVAELCLRCHAPMAHQQAILRGKPAPRLAEVKRSPKMACRARCASRFCPMGFLPRPRSVAIKRLVTSAAFLVPIRIRRPGRCSMLVRYTPTQSLHVREAARRNGSPNGCQSRAVF
jgi:hypothetical protein